MVYLLSQSPTQVSHACSQSRLLLQIPNRMSVDTGTVIMGVITDMLRTFDYCEWDGTFGSMIGASYDWRLTPPLLEKRDEFFTRMMVQTEAMVTADPKQRPAVVIGFSLGCRIAKYFIHFCHDRKGAEWMSR